MDGQLSTANRNVDDRSLGVDEAEGVGRQRMREDEEGFYIARISQSCECGSGVAMYLLCTFVRIGHGFPQNGEGPHDLRRERVCQAGVPRWG